MWKNDMQSNERSSTNDENLFEAAIDVPDTSELKSRIMQLTATMPQQMVHGEQAEGNDLKPGVSLLGKLFEPQFIAPFAVAATIALIAVLWVPSASEQATSSDVSAKASFTVHDDLDFQEAMIFFDEQIFVQH